MVFNMKCPFFLDRFRRNLESARDVRCDPIIKCLDHPSTCVLGRKFHQLSFVGCRDSGENVR